ncbi:hypothetical protein WY13_03352 [Clostridium ljungdahlii]|uniref:DUF4417 domain-containing protein n=2 Tax=Clostridium ljungdahlii TaxID=1538 RepID=A0A168LQN9_9CLOT|nr:hypothetical protein WY13_03352 [Clostridium ljungdahlii]
MKRDSLKERKEKINNKLLRNEFPSDNKWGIPKLAKANIEVSDVKLMGFDRIGRTVLGNEDKVIHFFLDDSKFNCVYDKPENSLKKLARFKAVLTPDFSLYMDMPPAIQINNVFKNRWCGAYWQDYGFTVIPTIGWSNEQSFEYCFLGIERRSTVAVSTVGNRRSKDDFMKGYDAMFERINPSIVLCYGKPFQEMRGDVVYISYLDSTGRCCA